MSMRIRSAALLAILISTSVSASERPLWLRPVEIGGVEEVDACSLGLIIGLDDATVMSGPGTTKYARVDRRTNGQKVYVCGERDGWYAVVYHPSGQPDETCGVSTPLPKRRPYKGPCRSGWIHTNNVDIIAG